MGSHPSNNTTTYVNKGTANEFRARAEFIGVSKNVVTVKFHIAVSTSSVQPTYKLGGSWTHWGVKIPWGFNSSNSYECEGSSSTFYDKDSPGINYAITKTFTLTEANQTYYVGIGWGSEIVWHADWTDSPETITITYNANGGTGGPTSTSKYYGINKTLSTSKPTRTGYNFLGWSTSKTATSATYAAGANYTGNSSVTLYAVWKANTYSVTYNANGGSGAPSAQTKTHGVSLTLSSTKPTRTGYTFQGWGTSSTTSTVSYAAGASYTGNSNLSLYAVWKANTYKVTFDANGGSGAPSAQTKTYGVSLTLSSTKPTRTGYTFQGWGTSSTTSTVSYAAGASYTGNSNLSLYAVWKANTYKVTFDANGGSGAPAAQTKTHEVDLTLSLIEPIKDNYIFKGWSTTIGGPVIYLPGSIYNSNKSITLYAKWSGNNYTINFIDSETNQLIYTTNKIHGIPIRFNLDLLRNEELMDLLLQKLDDGYNLAGWVEDIHQSGPSYSSSYFTVYDNSDLDLYTLWYDMRLDNLEINIKTDLSVEDILLSIKNNKSIDDIKINLD